MEVQESGNNLPIDCLEKFEESTKVDSSSQDYNENENSTTYVQSETTYNIPLQTHNLIINGEVVDCLENNTTASTPYLEEKGTSVGVTEALDHSNEFETISLQDESMEDVIVTTLSEVINSENEALITTTAGALHSTCNDMILVESSENNSDKIHQKLEESSLTSSNLVLDESLPSFIGEIDESVSLPPAEPLILEEEHVLHRMEITQEIVTQNTAETEQTSGDVTESETATGNVADEEDTGDNLTENESLDETNSAQKDSFTVNESQAPMENIPSAVVINDNIELCEEQQNELLASSEPNFQYTVLPPGENSVYQEDGTLVVEYPLNTEGTNISEFIKSHEVGETSTSSENQVGSLIKREENLLEMIENPSEDQDIVSQAAKIVKNAEENQKQDGSHKPKRRGRKAGEGIPPHIVGATIDNPSQDINGKGFKPRLGVKIPYRKLASQIVSTSELQNHIMERARMKEEARSEESKTTSFAKKLTHRLAQSLLSKKDPTSKSEADLDSKKSQESGLQLIENILAAIPPTANDSTEEQPTNPIEIVEQIVNEETVTSDDTSSKEGEVDLSVSTSESIENAEIIFAENMQNPTNIESNSDLIAILEGDGDESSIVNVPNVVEIVETSENTSEIKAIENEISLTEQKTPQVKEKKFFKSRDSRISDVAKDKVKEAETKTKGMSSTAKPKFSSAKNEDLLKTNIFDIESTSVLKTSKNIESKKGVVEKIKKSGTIIEVEPQLKPAMVLKTYTRKRKSNDVATPEPVKKALIVPTPPSQPDSKIDCATPVPPNVYVTKSSRVIKKKVIWDPDEAMPSVRSQSKILSKIETTTKAATPSKLTVGQKATPTKTADKKLQEKEKQADQSKVVKANEKKVTKPTQEEKDKKITPEKQTIKKPEKVDVPKKPIAKTPEKTITQAKIVITSSTKIIPAKSPKKSTKRLTEIDKLLMDEGAANMLNDINNSDDQKRRVSGRTGSSTPTDKVQNLKGTTESRNEATEEINIVPSTPKSLRRKDGAQPMKKDRDMKEPSTITRKMSKDSSKSSTHSPPPSPAAFTAGETSRIIRRHSSSSFSSNENLVQDESMDDTSEKEAVKQVKRKEVPAEESGETIEDSSSQEEQEKTKDKKKRPSFLAASIPKKRFKRENPVVANGEPLKPTEIIVKSEPGVVTGPLLRTDPSKAFTVIKMNKHYMINLTYFGGDNYLTVQLLRDLVVTLRELERTRNCSVISINSQGPNFCLGIDYKDLVESDEKLRSKKISDMSNAIRDLLMCLLGFSKIIVAGVKGDCVGLGVTMLPLFDMIVSTDTANFCTPYAKVGCPPEAGFLLSIPYQSNHGLASELLYTAHRMNADEAQRRGLVTKLFWPEKFDSEFRQLLSHISNLSKPALMVTKRQLRQTNQAMAETEITRNCRLLKKYWESEECQRDFVNYNALTFDIDHQ